MNICTSRSFGTLITELLDIKEAVANFAAKLRKQKSCAGSLSVFLSTNSFQEMDKQ